MPSRPRRVNGVTSMATRRRTAGRIYKRKNSPHWWLDYTARNSSGETVRVRESSGCTDEADALAELDRRITEKVGGRRADARGLTIAQLLDDLIREQKVRRVRSVWRTEEGAMPLRRYFAAELAVEVARGDIDAYVLHRRDRGVSDGTIGRELDVLRGAYKTAAEVLHYAPKFPRLRSKPREGFYSEADFDRLLGGLPNYLKPYITFLWWTGWRAVSEAAVLTWSANVDWDAYVVRLAPGTTKNEDGREWPLRTHPQLWNLLKRQQQSALRLGSEWIFHDERGNPLWTWKDKANTHRHLKYRVRQAWKAACEWAGLDSRILHDFRRTAVRRLERTGISRSVAMALTGHRSQDVYHRYAITSIGDLEAAVARLSGTQAAQSAEELAQ